MDIKKVGVVGCGLMGHGIAQVSAQSGYDVVVREVSQEKLDSGLGKIQQAARPRGREGPHGAGAGRRGAGPHQRRRSTYEDFAECDLVIEAITEDLDAKLEMWRDAGPDRQGGGAVRDQHVVASA